SGVVSALLSSLTYIGIFQKAVYDVMYNIEYLKTRHDLPELWNRVARAICRDKFPDFTQQLSTHILAKYLPSSDTNFIYSRYDRECILDWYDKAKNIVRWTENVTITLIPSSPDASVIYPYSSWTDSRTPHDIAKVNIDALEINGVKYDPNDIIKEEEYD